MDPSDANESDELQRLGLEVSAPLGADTMALVRYLADRGAGREELQEALRTRSLGPLALELALRGPGETMPFDQAADGAGLEPEAAAVLWRALGFPDPLRSSSQLWHSQVETLSVLAELGRSELGSETTLQLARVIGGSVALVAEAIVDAFRVRVEMPRLDAGQPYSEVVADYARLAPVQMTALTQAVGDVMRAHMVAVARARWAPDVSKAAITRERTVGFADLVGYTTSARTQTPAQLAAAISRFESHVGEVVSRTGGRVVKLIGDEAMFVVGDEVTACRLALELTRTLQADQVLPAVRIGLAAGPVVSHHGDYYGDVVNLASRLVKVARPGEVLVSQAVADGLSGAVEFEAVRTPPLKGYDQGVLAFRLRQP